ncbi:hypothetical protein [Nonomuraea rubra]|uniref:DUF4190 domain-containing protein n=1 Tax=Nonomuraea rubra TaxID=46180 RepID=A0A7X0U617_9ACTN|nr:hypothetical protein [Nonomuraea rubra]MBB6556139.1 hypothetical protein [Nonomuraea rubra]
MQPWQQSGPQQPPSQPYGPPQQPPNPYGQQYTPQQQPSYAPAPAGHAAPRRGQGLAITTVALGLVAVLLALTTLRGVGLAVALVTAILATIALAAKSQGGTWFAVTGLVLSMLSLPVAFLVWTLSAEPAQSDAERQKALQECIAKNPEKVLECAGWE